MECASQAGDFSSALTARLERTAEEGACKTLPDSQPSPRDGRAQAGSAPPRQQHEQREEGDSPRAELATPSRRGPAPSFSAWSDPAMLGAISQANGAADSGSSSPRHPDASPGSDGEHGRRSQQDTVPELRWAPSGGGTAQQPPATGAQGPEQGASPRAHRSPFQDLHLDPVRPGRGRVSHEIPDDMAQRWSFRMGQKGSSNGGAGSGGQPQHPPGRRSACLHPLCWSSATGAAPVTSAQGWSCSRARGPSGSSWPQHAARDALQAAHQAAQHCQGSSLGALDSAWGLCAQGLCCCHLTVHADARCLLVCSSSRVEG